jgi:Xaa-Pro dipeptidase
MSAGSEHFWRIPFDWESRKEWLEMPFPVEEYEARVARIRKLMSEQGIDYLVAWSGPGDTANVRYIANFESWWGHSFVVVPASGDLVFLTDAIFHGEPMHSNVHMTWIKDVRPLEHAHSAKAPKNLVDEIADIVRAGGGSSARVAVAGLENCPQRFAQRIDERLGKANVVSGSKLMYDVRAIKSPREQAIQREACRIADAGLMAAIDAAKPGVSEIELAGIVHGTVFGMGAESLYTLQVGAGARGALKNCRASSRKLVDGDILALDVVLSYHGYHTDTHRSVMIGKPSELQLKMLDGTLAVEDAVVPHIKPGVTVAELQEIGRKEIRKWGLEQYYYDFLGHGCGLTLVERPMMFPGSTEVLEAGMTFYLEPMVVVHNLATACNENLVLVTETGCEFFSHAPRKHW